MTSIFTIKIMLYFYEKQIHFQEWKKHGVTQLKIPTVDFTATPTQEDICKAVDFIQDYRDNKKGSVYVHCKAGRTRSATVVACYLVKVSVED